MNPEREPRSEFAVAAVQGVGMLGLIGGGVFVMSGLRDGSIRPAEIAAKVPVWRDALVSALPMILGAAGAVAVLVLCAVLAVSYRATLAEVGVAAWWRYRRRWAAAMADSGLTVTTKGRTEVPALRAVRRAADHDVLTVEMASGQAPADWHNRAPGLAAALGASTAHVALGATPTDIDLVLSRPGPGRRRELAPRPSAALALPPVHTGNPARDLVALRAGRIAFAWAFVRVTGKNGTPRRRRIVARVRWETMSYYGYAQVGGTR
ncbi:hypothetical protein [Nocardia cyriacigeorgica]|uniref:hypothetical protein n=1 Tax=Nocardia cyriacigeorgica TaxID=135487 RepID=UPI002456C8A9|nr:hypothetical protein [Nocardia cyriacigeorgica]